MKKLIKLKSTSILISMLTILTIVVCSCNEKDYTILADSIEPVTVTSLSANEGEIGTEITILGTNFSRLSSNNKVRFNDTPATVITSSETEIKVEIPNAVPVDEISILANVTVSHGQFTADAGDFTIIKPIVTLVIPLTDQNDDVEEVTVDFGAPVGTMDLTSSDLELGEKSSGQGLMNIGLRYNNVLISQGAIISEAYIQFNPKNS